MFPKRIVGVASTLCACLLAAAACSSGTPAATGTGEQPVRGGTLKVIGSGDVDHLDPASAYYTASLALERTFTRQLVSYPASPNTKTATTVVADLATEVPTKDNGGISADGRTYTFHLRRGAQWNTEPARPVTAQDVVRGMKRICNPASPSGAISYYQDTIAGFTPFCDGFAKVNPSSPKAMADYLNHHEISGVSAPNESTVVFRLKRPAADFLNILAEPFASAAPVEYLKYVPDDAQFRQHTLSDGPYMITRYAAGKEIDLARNPAWQQTADPIRHQYVKAITITEGQDSDAAVQQQLQAGTADLSWDLPVPTADIPALRNADDPNFGIYPMAASNPYLVFNLQSPNNGGALRKAAVRQALQYAVDKTAIGRVYGGPSLNKPLDQVIPPGQTGHETFDLYPTPGHKGDPAKCRALLAKAGYPKGLTLTDVVRNAGNHPAVAQSIQADFAKCGVTTKIVQVSQGDYYGKYLNDPSGTRAGRWDISEPGWVADWYGNNGRAFIAVLFDGRKYGPNSSNYGDYNSPVVNKLIDRALATQDPAEAAKLWHQADLRIMRDAAIIPIESQSLPLYHSTRVKNAAYSPLSQTFDYTNLWLNPAT